MNENSFIQIFHQGYRRFALSFSLHFLEQVLSSIRLSLARNESCRNQRTSLAHTQKKVTHTHKQHAHTENEVERFLGDFSMYTHMYIAYIYILIYV